MADSYRDYFNDRITQEMDRQKEYGLNAKYDAVQKASDEKIAQLKEEIRTNTRNDDLYWKSRTGSSVLEDFADVGLAGVQGAETLLKLPTMVVDKAMTGNFYGPATQKLSEWQDDQEKMKSALSQYKTQEKSAVTAERGQAVKDAVGDGLAGTAAQVATEFGSSFWEAMKDPTSIPEFLAQQAAQLGVTGKVGRTVEAGAKVAAKAAPKLAATKLGEAALEKSATAGAVGFSAGLQGIDVGSDTMQRLMALPDDLWLQNPEYLARAQEVGADAAKQEIASDLASKATLAAAGASLLSTKMVPGGAALEKALVGKGKASIGMVPKVFAAEGTQEGLEEGSGQFLNNVATRQINPNQSLAEGVGNAAGQGAFMGGLLGGGVQALNTTVPESIRNLAVARVQESSDQDTLKAIIASGDVSALVDPKSATYNPGLAVQGLQAIASQEGKSAEDKQAALEQAAKVVSDAQTHVETLKNSLSRITKEGLVADLAMANDALAATDPTDTNQVNVIKTWIDGVQGKIDRFDEKAAAETLATRQQEITALEDQIQASKDTVSRFRKDLQSVDVDVEAEAKNITAADPVASQAAADKIINLSMAAPERLSDETAQRLAQSESLTADQRAYFRVFSKARAHANSLLTMGETSQEIYLGAAADPTKGKPRMLGIKDYREEVGNALATGDRKEAARFLILLKAFATGHAKKAKLVTDAYAEVKAGGADRRLVRLADGNWKVEEGKFASADARQENGGLDITKASAKLPREIQTEAAALSSAYDELTAAYKVKFGGSNVKNVSPAPGVQESSTEQATAPAEASAEAGAASDEQGSAKPDVQSSKSADTAEAAQADGVTEEASGSSAKTVETVSTESTKSTTAETQSTEEGTTVEDVPEAALEDASSTQGLSVFQDKSADEVLPAGTKLGAVYRTLNKAVAFLTQTKKRIEKDADIAKDRPLVSVGNLLSLWNAGTVVPTDFFQESLTDEEIGSLTNFQKFANKWAPLIREQLIKGGLANLKGVKPRADFLFEDPLQDFFNADGSVDENLVTAIAYGAYSWMAETVNGTALKDSEAILKMNGLRENMDLSVTTAGMKALSDLATTQDRAAANIGKHIVDALGLKANAKAEANYMAKLQTAFGLQAIVLLASQDLIDTVNYTGAEMNEFIDGLNVDNEFAQFEYVRVVRSNLKLTGANKEIKDSSVGSRGVLTRMFSSEASPAYASWVPRRFSQAYAKKTGQNITEKQRKILDAAQQVPHRIIPAMWNALNVLGDTVILQAAGWKEYDESKLHVENRLNMQAKNDGLEVQLEGMKNLVQDAEKNSPNKLEQAFYATYEVWRNFRVGVATQDMNLQGSKIHRFMFYRPEWVTKLNLNDRKAMDRFELAVAQAFGVKVDQQNNVATLQLFNDRMAENDGAIKKLAMAVAAAIESNDANALTGGQKQEVAEFAAGREGMQSLQALVAYGKVLNAVAQQESGADVNDVTVHMLVGVDGKTNGPILTQLALGAADTAKNLFTRLNRGGMYKSDDGVKNYNHWYERATSLDLYEDLAFQILNGIAVTKDFAAISVFTKKLIDENEKVTTDGRKLAKTPLTAFIFGSSIDGSVRSMQEAFVQQVIDRIEAVATGQDKKTSRADLIFGLNQLLGTNLSENTPIDELMEKRFTKADRQKLADKFYEQIGSRVEDTMKAYFETYLNRRNDINRTIQGSFEIYNAIYQDLKAKEIQRLIEAGEIDTVERDGKKVPIHNMTMAQEQALREKVKAIMPMANTAYTVDNNELDAGLMMAKNSPMTSDEASNRVKIQLGKRIPKKNGYPVSTFVGQALTQSERNPGVAGLPYFMHSLDSFIMHMSLIGTETLNVHDEAANGVGNVEKTAQAINQSTWEGMLKFSPATESYNMLVRVLQNAAQMAQAGELSPEALAGIKQALRAQLPYALRNEIADDKLASVVLDLAFRAQFEANRVRLETLAQMTSIDQYTWEGGEYMVTKQDRQNAQEALQKHLQVSAVDPTLIAATEALNKALAETSVKADPVVIEQDKTVGKSSIGELGKPAIASDRDLVEFFRVNPNATAKQVIDLLSAAGRLSPVNRKLLQLVSRVVSADLPIQYVTSRTTEEQVLEKAKSPSRGWYVVKGNAESIYVLSPEFKNSGLTAETLLHELIHAAVAKTIANPTAEGKKLVGELESLMAKAKEFAAANGLTQFDAALNDVQEFVAWGMSNLDFQKEVLTKITFESKTRGSALVTGMQKFISTLVGLLYKKPDENMDSGLSVLVSNVSGLFNEASQQTNETTSINLSQQSQQAGAEFTAQQVFKSLDKGNVSPSFQSHMSNLLSGMVQSVYGPFGTLKEAMKSSMASTPMDAWLKAIETGVAPFASKLVNSNFAASAQEVFVMEQVEATVASALSINDITTKPAYRELYKLFTEAKETLTVQDFVNAGFTAADHAFVFNIEGGNDGRSDYLSRFAALGLANEKFKGLLNFKTEAGRVNVGNEKSLFDRLNAWFEQILAYFNHKATNTYAGQKADSKLEALVDRLMDIEAKHRFKANAGETAFQKYGAVVEDMTKDLVDASKQKVIDFANSPIVRNSSSGIVKWGAAIGKVAASGRAAAVMTALRSLRDHATDERDGVWAGLMREMKGPAELVQALLLMTKHSENLRQNAIAQTASVLLKEFKNGGKSLGKEDKVALTSVLLRSGAHNLMGQYSLAQIAQMVSSNTALDQEIAAVEASLTTGLKQMHINMAKGLGYFKATDLNTVPFLMRNAYVIARMLDTQYAGQITEAQAAAEESKIASLVSLYAIKYSTVKDRQAVSSIMEQENLRTDGNGVDLMLKLHKDMEQESLDRLFNGNRVQMTHGYTPEIYDAYVTIQVANEQEGARLVAQGYEKGDLVTSDKNVPDAAGVYGMKQHIYIRRDGGLTRRVSGVMSLTGMKAKGTMIHNGFMNTNTYQGTWNASLQNSVMIAKQGELAAMASNTNFDPTANKQVNVAPVYNDNGHVVNWAHMMGGKTKDRILKRENRFDKVMGTLAGSIIDKHKGRELNEQAITALLTQYTVEKSVTPWSYVEIGPLSSDPENRELWDLLPEQTRMDIRKIWGRDSIMVRKDSVDVIFGYRKLSAGDFLNKERKDLEGVELMARNLFNSLALYRGKSQEEADDWAKRMGAAVVKGERGWQEIYKEVKDIIVVKNLITLLGNIHSNVSLLWLLGVDDGWKRQWTALRGIMAYEEHSKRLMEIQMKLDSGYAGNRSVLEQEVVRLQNEIARNPVTKLVEAGLMPTIVEDVDLQEDPYSYKSELSEKLEKWTNKLPESVRKASKVVYMTHDTPLYKVLSRATQYSDFVARYAMYEHLTTGKEPMSHDKAILKTLNAFVHYDVPMQRNLQYLDDMGFTPFMKYFYRVQRVLFETMRERPARALSMILLNRFVDLGPIVLDSSLVHHAGNMPFRGGALQLPGVLDELLTVQAGLAVVK
jgi:predicted  nucleic acid-binding Zn-ribbon protein